MDPVTDTYIILLTNAVHPRGGDIGGFASFAGGDRGGGRTGSFRHRSGRSFGSRGSRGTTNR